MINRNILNDKLSGINKFLLDIGAEQNIYDKYHHIYGSLNLNVPIPPPQYWEVWDYKNTNPICLQRDVSLLDWNVVLVTKTLDQKVRSLNNHLLNYSEMFFL